MKLAQKIGVVSFSVDLHTTRCHQIVEIEADAAKEKLRMPGDMGTEVNCFHETHTLGTRERLSQNEELVVLPVDWLQLITIGNR